MHFFDQGRRPVCSPLSWLRSPSTAGRDRLPAAAWSVPASQFDPHPPAGPTREQRQAQLLLLPPSPPSHAIQGWVGWGGRRMAMHGWRMGVLKECVPQSSSVCVSTGFKNSLSKPCHDFASRPLRSSMSLRDSFAASAASSTPTLHVDTHTHTHTHTHNHNHNHNHKPPPCAHTGSAIKGNQEFRRGTVPEGSLCWASERRNRPGQRVWIGLMCPVTRT